jgi:catechol 2,3-dioxygenase-like lactoylglutathione lyase family enzyme
VITAAAAFADSPGPGEGDAQRRCKLDAEGRPSMNFKLELVLVPVTDVDRAVAFYTEKVGFHLDQDNQVNDGLRFVQLTPPGSACSIAFGLGITDAPVGSARVQLVVDDAHAARKELLGRGLDVGEVQTFPWGSFLFFRDPDGNKWSVQQLPPRG